MYKDAYSSNHKPIQISVVQIVLIAVILFGSFVVPAALIDRARVQQIDNAYSQETIDARQAQVAGLQTSSDTSVQLPVLGISIDLNNQTTLLVSGALLLAGIACIITIYLLVSPRKKH